MPRYQVQGYGKDSGRRRKRIYIAVSEDEAVHKAADDGTIVETFTELSPVPARPEALDAMRREGYDVPDDITQDEIRDLQTQLYNQDYPAKSSLKQRAAAAGVEFTRYAGHNALLLDYLHYLQAAGRKVDLAREFAHIVAQALTNSAWDDPKDSNVTPEVFTEVAHRLEDDEKFYNSLKGILRNCAETYRDAGAAHVFRFGDGYSGTISRGTYAYKACAGLLRPVLGLQRSGGGLPSIGAEKRSKRQSKRGCLAP